MKKEVGREMAHEFAEYGENLCLNVPYAEAYVPASLFTESSGSVAMEYGEGFKLVGIFNMRFFESDSVPRESAPLRVFNYPNTIVTYPDSSTTQKLSLIPGTEPDTYRIFRYYYGDIVMGSESVEAVANCTKFLTMITHGKIPETIPYDEFIHIWENNFKINSFNPGVPSVSLQMIWAEMCRSKKDITIPFRMEFGRGNVSPTDYISTNMNNVASATSVFSGLSFERIGDKIASGINMTRSGAEQRRSPVEEILTM